MNGDSIGSELAFAEPHPGARIRELRLARGLTQRQLALAAGLSVTVLRDLEQGVTRIPRAATVRKLATPLGTDLASPRRPGTGMRRSRGRGASGLWIRVLGPLAAWRGNVELPLGPVRQRAVLAILALHPGQIVHRDSISAIIWRNNPPSSATAMIQSAISQVRRALAPVGGAPVLATAGAGYQLMLADSQLDLIAYTRLARAATTARRRGDAELAWDLYDQALALWSDEPLADLDVLRSSALLTGLRARHASLVADYAEDASERGNHARVLPHLHALVQQDPFDERAHACLMIALAGSGNQAAALLTYEHMRARLDLALGLAPGPLLRQAQTRVLRGNYRPAAADIAPDATRSVT